MKEEPSIPRQGEGRVEGGELEGGGEGFGNLDREASLGRRRRAWKGCGPQGGAGQSRCRRESEEGGAFFAHLYVLVRESRTQTHFMSLTPQPEKGVPKL